MTALEPMEAEAGAEATAWSRAGEGAEEGAVLWVLVMPPEFEVQVHLTHPRSGIIC